MKNNKENATESFGSSLRLFAWQFLMKNNKEIALESSVIVNECSGKALMGTPPLSENLALAEIEVKVGRPPPPNKCRNAKPRPKKTLTKVRTTKQFNDY